LAKRDGAVTVRELRAAGVPVADAIAWIARSLELAAPGEAVTMGQLVGRFDPGRLPRHVCPAPDLTEPTPDGPKQDK
jgi:glutamyl-tRNA synthetase